VTERTTSEGTTRYVYDGDGRMTQLTAPDGKTVVYTYDAAGRNTRTLQQLNPGIELVTDKRFDNQDRQTHIAHSKQTSTAKTLIAGQAIVRGQGGAVQRLETYDEQAGFDEAAGSFTGSPSRVQAFAYDANARLTSEKEYKGAELQAWLTNNQAQATKSTTYGYDSVGNRVSKGVTTPQGTESTSYSYDVNDRLTTETLTTATGSISTTTYTWDANGNMASRASPSEYTGYTFDADNRLIEVKRGQTQATAIRVAKYRYDADGQRVRKTTPGEMTFFLIDPTTTWPQVVVERNGNGQITRSTTYIWGDNLHQQAAGEAGAVTTAPEESLIPLTGHLGSTIAIADEAGLVAARYESTGWGEPVNNTSRARHQFAGEYWDSDIALQYTRERWYSPAGGRFITIDPVSGTDRRPSSQNRYFYANADPLTLTDPSGRMSLGEVGAGLVAAYTIATVALPVYNYLFDPPVAGGNEGATSVWDAVFIGLVGSSISDLGEKTEKLYELYSQTKNWNHLTGTADHHIIPKHLCGHPDQKLVRLRRGDHVLIHAQLDTLAIAFELAGNKAAKYLKPGWKGRVSIKDVASRPAGRIGITIGLRFFSWWETGIPSPKTYPTIGVGFGYEAKKFTGGFFHSQCRKK
jgi:RHS repeat-associated protein